MSIFENITKSISITIDKWSYERALPEKKENNPELKIEGYEVLSLQGISETPPGMPIVIEDDKFVSGNYFARVGIYNNSPPEHLKDKYGVIEYPDNMEVAANIFVDNEIFMDIRNCLFKITEYPGFKLDIKLEFYADSVLVEAGFREYEWKKDTNTHIEYFEYRLYQNDKSETD